MRHASLYRLGATGPLADFAAKKYRAHRSVTQMDLVAAMAEKKIRDAVHEKKKVK
jgi:hypothetical protein